MIRIKGSCGSNPAGVFIRAKRVKERLGCRPPSGSFCEPPKFFPPWLRIRRQFGCQAAFYFE